MVYEMKTDFDYFKQRTLNRLAAKQENFNTYPISESDLLILDHCNLCGSTNISLLTEVYLNYKLNFFTTGVCNDCLYTFRPISPSNLWFKKCWQQIFTNKLEVFNPDVEKIRKCRYKKYGSSYEFVGRYMTITGAH